MDPEPGRGLVGLSGVDQMSTRAEQGQGVADVDMGQGVGGEDNGAALVGQQAEQQHDLLVEPRVESRGRLVEEQDLGLAQQLGSDRHPLALPATQRLDDLVALVAQPDQRQRPVDAPLAQLGGCILAQPEPGLVAEGLGHGQVGVDDVILGNEAHLRGLALPAGAQVDPVVGDRAVAGFHLSGEKPHQGGLPRPAGTGHRGEASGPEGERHVVEEPADTASPPPHLHRGSDDRDVDAGNLFQRFESMASDAGAERSDLDDVADDQVAPAPQALAVHVGAVDGVLVLDPELAGGRPADPGVPGPDQRVGQADRRFEIGADVQRVAGGRQRGAQLVGGDLDREQVRDLDGTGTPEVGGGEVDQAIREPSGLLWLFAECLVVLYEGHRPLPGWLPLRNYRTFRPLT